MRFQTALGFHFDPPTSQALKENAKLIRKMSAERVRDEITSMLQGSAPVEALQSLLEHELLPEILPEVAALRGLRQSPVGREGSVWKHTLKVFMHLRRLAPQRSAALCWAALLHSTGKVIAAKKSDGKNFNGYDQDSAERDRRRRAS